MLDRPPPQSSTPVDSGFRWRLRAPPMLSSMDDYPLHQIAEPIRHVGTSDRNFYDRYYFNLHGSSDELFMVMGMGQYPNLARAGRVRVRARAAARTAWCARRASSATAWTRRVGPFRVEVIEAAAARALRRSSRTSTARLRPHLERRDPGVRGAAPVHPQARPRAVRHAALRADRLLGGHARGRAARRSTSRPTAGRARATARGACARSARPSRPASARREGQMTGMWNYAPMQFDDYSILYIVQETNDGRARARGGGARSGTIPAREPEWLGRPEYEHTLDAGHAHDRAVDAARSPHAPGGGFDVDGHAAHALRSSRSAPATAWSTTGATACTRGRSSCRAREVGRRGARDARASTASSTTSRASRSATATSATACTSTASSAPFAKYGMTDAYGGAS